MVSVPSSADPSLRLADQLQVLSQVTESLTYRLLELEERLGGQERRITQRLEEAAGAEAAHGEAMDQRLADTEERLARIESALQGLDRQGAGRHLQAVVPPALQQDLQVPRTTSHGFDPDHGSADPFIDEGEQPFMDELIA